MAPPIIDLAVRLERLSIPEPNTGCHLWLGNRYQRRYGRLLVGNRQQYAHRVAYEVAKGPIPAELTIDHLCRQTLCVNPDHLEVVTRSVNMKRRPDVQAAGTQTHCQRGHLLDGVHRYPTRTLRYCLTCHRERERVRRARRRAA